MSSQRSAAVLWAHLLRKGTPTPENIPPQIPPIAPIDKNATSMRILLHDTQANFEAFSGKIDKVTTVLDKARQEVVTVKSLFEKEHESLSTELNDLVSTCRNTLQKTIGAPVQKEQLNDLTKEFFLRLDSLDKRYDSLDKRLEGIQILVHSFSLTLQTQAQSLQTLQDLQAKLVSSLFPIIPLLEDLPNNIHLIQEVLRPAVVVSATSPQTSSSAKRGHADISDTVDTPPSHKRRKSSEQQTDGTSTFPSARTSSVNPFYEPSSHTPNRPLPSTLASSPDPYIHEWQTNINVSESRLTLDLNSTRPLIQSRSDVGAADLPNQQSPSPTEVTNPLFRPHLKLLSHNSSQSSKSILLSPLPPMKTSAPSDPWEPRSTERKPSALIFQPRPSAPSAVLHALRNLESTRPNHDIDKIHMSFTNGPQEHAAKKPSVRSMTVNVPSAPTNQRIKTRKRIRRSPFREGRRFIPLDDSDDDESEC